MTYIHTTSLMSNVRLHRAGVRLNPFAHEEITSPTCRVREQDGDEEDGGRGVDGR